MPIRLVVLPGDALEADVKAGKTFFRDSKAAEKTGTMPTKAIVAAAETYEEGYHAGDVGGLSAIETDLAPANIKKDENIFGKVGTYEAEAAVAETAIAKYESVTTGVGSEWVTKGSDTIASTVKIIVAMGTTATNGGTSEPMQVQVLYNSVQQSYRSATTDQVVCGSYFAGLGSEAELEIQHYGNSVLGCGGYAAKIT